MQKRSPIDRRQRERRKGFDLAVIDKLGVERRMGQRRLRPEQRQGWTRAYGWTSVKMTKAPWHRVVV